MIVDHPISERPAGSLIARELAAVAASSILYPFGFGKRHRMTPRRREQRTVVLVHGYLANRSTLYPLEAYLRLRGVRQIHTFDYRSSDDIEPAARALREHLRRTVRGGRIDL